MNLLARIAHIICNHPLPCTEMLSVNFSVSGCSFVLGPCFVHSSAIYMLGKFGCGDCGREGCRLSWVGLNL
jgi:hypothetical protein